MNYLLQYQQLRQLKQDAVRRQPQLVQQEMGGQRRDGDPDFELCVETQAVGVAVCPLADQPGPQRHAGHPGRQHRADGTDGRLQWRR